MPAISVYQNHNAMLQLQLQVEFNIVDTLSLSDRLVNMHAASIIFSVMPSL